MVNDGDADENFFGVIIYERGNVVYKSLYNLGLFKACLLSVRQYHLDEITNMISAGIFNGFELTHHRTQRDFLKKLDNTVDLLNVLFAEHRICSV